MEAFAKLVDVVEELEERVTRQESRLLALVQALKADLSKRE